MRRHRRFVVVSALVVSSLGVGVALAQGTRANRTPSGERARHSVVQARMMLQQWRVAEEARPCDSVTACSRRTVLLDGVPLAPSAIERAYFQRWASGLDAAAVAPLRLDDEQRWRQALATAVFLEEMKAEVAPVAESARMRAKAQELSRIQAKALGDLTPAQRAELTSLGPDGVPLADPASPAAVDGYARYLAREEVIDRMFGVRGGGIDIAKARAWLAGRLRARNAAVSGVGLREPVELAAYLELGS